MELKYLLFYMFVSQATCFVTENSESGNTGITFHFGILLKREQTFLKDTKFAELWEK
jgi:hypothetical protein